MHLANLAIVAAGLLLSSSCSSAKDEEAAEIAALIQKTASELDQQFCPSVDHIGDDNAAAEAEWFQGTILGGDIFSSEAALPPLSDFSIGTTTTSTTRTTLPPAAPRTLPGFMAEPDYENTSLVLLKVYLNGAREELDRLGPMNGGYEDILRNRIKTIERRIAEEEAKQTNYLDIDFSDRVETFTVKYGFREDPARVTISGCLARIAKVSVLDRTSESNPKQMTTVFQVDLTENLFGQKLLNSGVDSFSSAIAEYTDKRDEVEGKRFVAEMRNLDATGWEIISISEYE